MMLRIASVIAFCAVLSEALMYSLRRTDIRAQDIPPADQPALVARYVVNQVDYAAVATISTRKETETYPIANVISISDGPIGNGSGIPYMYITPLGLAHIAQDLEKDNRATLLVSLAETNYCQNKQLDPMDPRCPRVMLTGKFAAVNDTAEYKTEAQLFSERHPYFKDLVASFDRKFYLVKFDIDKIALLHNFDGLKYIPVEDYFHPPVNHIVNKLYEHSFVEHRV